MKHSIRFLLHAGILPVVFAGLSGCFTVHTHQTAKTLGKGASKGTVVGGLSGVPSFTREPFNDGNGLLMFPVYTLRYGIAEYTDAGAFLGVSKLGAFFKHQFVGDQQSKGAISIGANAFAGSDVYLLSSVLSFARSEIPLYLSYEITPKFALYSSPLVAYHWERESSSSTNEKSFSQYLAGGATIGCMFTLRRITLSGEVGAQKEWEFHKYQFYSTIGLGFSL